MSRNEFDQLETAVRDANPVPQARSLIDSDESAAVAVLVRQGQEAVTAARTGPVTPTTDSRQKPPRRWRKQALAFAVACLLVLAIIGIPALLRNSSPSVAIDESRVATTVAITTPLAQSAQLEEMNGPYRVWNPILAVTQAKTAPPAATCPPGTDPNASGPSDQARPGSSRSGLVAAFDRRAGSIVHVNAVGETWTFDVCTNTWQEMHPQGTPYEYEGDLVDAAGQPSGLIGNLVYDVDSDLTIEFGHLTIHVYDAKTNTWTPAPKNEYGIPNDLHPFGAVYDPVSGLIITTISGPDDRWDVWAYDVETSTWTWIGPVPLERTSPCCTGIDLLGYSQEIDRLILTTYGNLLQDPDEDASPTLRNEEWTLLIDPRTGEMTKIPTPTPVVNLGWPGRVYGPAGDTVYVTDNDGGVCGFDTDAVTWTLCFDEVDRPGDSTADVYAAMVGDPINDRLVLINGLSGDWWTDVDTKVWAIDLGSGEWTQILASAGR